MQEGTTIFLECAVCGKTQQFRAYKDAFMDGWNFNDGDIITCPKCDAPIVAVRELLAEKELLVSEKKD